MASGIKSTILGLIVVVSAYWIPAQFLSGATMIEASSAGSFGAAMIAAIAWSRSAGSAANNGIGNERELFILAIFFGQLMVSMRGLWSVVYRYLDKPTVMVDHPLFGFIVYMLMISSVLYIAAPGTVKGDVPAKNWGYLIGAGVVAGIFLGFMLGRYASGDFGPIP